MKWNKAKRTHWLEFTYASSHRSIECWDFIHGWANRDGYSADVMQLTQALLVSSLVSLTHTNMSALNSAVLQVEIGLDTIHRLSWRSVTISWHNHFINPAGYLSDKLSVLICVKRHSVWKLWQEKPPPNRTATEGRHFGPGRLILYSND